MSTIPELNLQLFGGDEPPTDPTPSGNEPPTSNPTPTDPQPDDKDPGTPTETEPKQSGTMLGGESSQVTYDFSSIIPEGVELDQQALTEYTELAKTAGLSPELANKLGAFGIDLQQKAYQAAVDQRVAEIQSWQETAKQELGNELDSTMTDAAKGLNVLEKSIPNLRQALNETGAGNRIEFIRMMATVGKLVSEESGLNLLAGITSGSTASQPSIYDKTDWSKYQY